MNIIPLPEPTPPTPAQRAAIAQLSRVNSAGYESVARHKELYRAFWDDPQATPAEILAEMGTNAALYLASANASIAQIESLAIIAGSTLDDVLPPEHREPRMPITVHDDGTVTIEQLDDHDAWGRPLPVIVDLPEPEPITEPDPVEPTEE